MLTIDENETRKRQISARNRRYAEYRREWAKQNLKKVCLSFRFDEYEEIKAKAEAMGETVNAFLKKAVKDRMKGGAE